jgi:hypothetical protein
MLACGGPAPRAEIPARLASLGSPNLVLIVVDTLRAEYLFDRRVDPGENVNLIEREASMAARMRTLLDAHLAEGGAGVVEKGVRVDPGIADRLRAMGYLR